MKEWVTIILAETYKTISSKNHYHINCFRTDTKLLHRKKKNKYVPIKREFVKTKNISKKYRCLLTMCLTDASECLLCFQNIPS